MPMIMAAVIDSCSRTAPQKMAVMGSRKVTVVARVAPRVFMLK